MSHPPATAPSLDERERRARSGLPLELVLGIAPVPWEWIRFETPLAAYSVVALRGFNDQGYIWSLQQFARRVE